MDPALFTLLWNLENIPILVVVAIICIARIVFKKLKK